MGLRDADPALYEQLSIPSLSVPVPSPPEDNGSYPEDQEHDGDESIIDSSLSVDEVAAWTAGEAPGLIEEPSVDEDGEVVGFGHEDSCDPAHVLEPFNSWSTTSSYRWDGTT